ncbi:MAG: GNAT family N-acetyltransferase [Firmicutes bacterium]|nr:GNAT family N-acetyltransferase [Bacillota bacterium]
MFEKKYNDYYIKLLNEKENFKEVDKFCKDNKDYFEKIERKESYLTGVKEFYYETPKNIDHKDKILIGVYKNGKLMCIFDILHNYPSLNAWYIGLMLVDIKHRYNQNGKNIYKTVENIIRNKDGNVIKLGVVEENNIAMIFWQNQGFVIIDKVKMNIGNEKRNVFVMEKKLL